MKKIVTFAVAGLMMLAGTVGYARSAFADDEEPAKVPETYLQLSPTNVVVALMGGDVLEGKAKKCPSDLEEGCAVQVKNIGTKTFQYRVYATPYVVKGENYDLDFSESASTSYTQISRWISFLGADGEYAKEIVLSIEPGETQTIHYRIEVPEDVPGGAQYAVIWAQTISNSMDENGVQTVSQAGMVISGRTIGDTQQTAEVTDYNFTRFALSGPLKAQATVKNTGNTDFDAHYAYTARTLFGKELYNKQGSIATFPGSEYHADVEWENTPLLGIFTVEFKITAADMVKTETHIVVIMPIFVLVLLILLLTVLTTWIIIIIRKRKERKARTLV